MEKYVHIFNVSNRILPRSPLNFNSDSNAQLNFVILLLLNQLPQITSKTQHLPVSPVSVEQSRQSIPLLMKQLQTQTKSKIKLDYKKMEQNQSTLELSDNTVTRIAPSLNTKVIFVSPIHTTNCEEHTEPSSIIYDNSSREKDSETLRSSANESSFKESPPEEDRDEGEESMRKLYKQMKREQRDQDEIQNEIHFLYQSSQGEKSFPQEQQQHTILQVRDQINEPDVMISKNSIDILNRRIPQKKMVECIVKIAATSLFSLEKQIELYLMKQKRLLLRAKKSRLPVATEFLVEGADSKPIAIFESNLSRSEYKYIKGAAKAKEKAQQQKHTEATYDSTLIKLNPVKVELSSLESTERCYLVFRPNLFGSKQERMKVIKPRSKVYKSARFSDIKSSYQNFQYDRLQILQSRLAQKNRKGELVLDFKTNNMMESSRNMIVQDQNGAVCLSFYKRKENAYMLAIISPFNIVEGFFIAVSILDHLFF